jgi:hypothetical protein
MSAVPQRWTIYPDPAGAGPEVYNGSPNDGDTEGIEVMPVSEHEAALAALREAAKPFVRHADDVDRLRHDDDSTCTHRMRAGDLRALRAALNLPERIGLP